MQNARQYNDEKKINGYVPRRKIYVYPIDEFHCVVCYVQIILRIYIGALSRAILFSSAIYTKYTDHHRVNSSDLAKFMCILGLILLLGKC